MNLASYYSFEHGNLQHIGQLCRYAATESSESDLDADSNWSVAVLSRWSFLD